MTAQTPEPPDHRLAAGADPPAPAIAPGSGPRGILYLHGTAEVGGSDLSLLDIVRRLDRREFRPVVVLPSRGPLWAAWERTGARIILGEAGTIRRGPRGVWDLARGCRGIVRGLVDIIREERVSLVHSNSSVELGGSIAARRAGIPHVWHVREFLEPSMAVAPLLRRWIVRRADRVVVISSALAARFRGIARTPDQVRVVRNGVDLHRFHPGTDGSALRREWGVDDDTLLVGAVGRLHPVKGMDVLLEGFAGALGARPDLRCVLVGQEPSPRHRRFADSLRRRAAGDDLAGRVIFAGNRIDMPEVIAAMDVLVQPSRFPEGLGRVITEAMAGGRPVIATRVGGPEDLVRHRRTGLLAPPGDPLALEAAILGLARDPRRRMEMGRAARAFAEEHLALGRRVRDLEEIYREVLLDRGRPAGSGPSQSMPGGPCLVAHKPARQVPAQAVEP